MANKTLKASVLVLAGAAIAIQFIQPDRVNPPADPTTSFETLAKPSPKTVALVQRACKDCHSNQTVWPWYSRVAPASWLVASDVQEGRAHLNLSEWNRLGPEMSMLKLRAMCAEVKDGEMPLWQYRLIHRDASLTATDVGELCTGLGAPAVVQ